MAQRATVIAERRSLNFEKGAAMEALSAGYPLTASEIEALKAIGLGTGNDTLRKNRSWNRNDDFICRRLAQTRGWSATAIAVFLNRPEDQVRAALNQPI